MTSRFRAPTALRIFEVDHPATQAWKRESFAAADIPLPPNLHWAPVDFERQTLSEQLAAAGFDCTQPACFSWLGVSQYLTLAAIDDTLHLVAGLPSPTTIVLSFVLTDDVLSDDEVVRKHLHAEGAASLGEPWLTFFRPDGLPAKLHGLGFARVFHLTPEEANARYFAGRRDGMQVLQIEQLISAST